MRCWKPLPTPLASLARSRKSTLQASYTRLHHTPSREGQSHPGSKKHRVPEWVTPVLHNMMHLQDLVVDQALNNVEDAPAQQQGAYQGHAR